MLTDLRLALRMHLKQPGFMLIAVLTLTLGIGATPGVQPDPRRDPDPPPYQQPEKLVLVHSLSSDGQLSPCAGEGADQSGRFLQRAAQCAGLDLSPHCFRHAHASHALDHGAPGRF